MKKLALLSRRWLFPVICLATVCSAVAQLADIQMPGTNTIVPGQLHHGAIALGSWNTTVEFKDIVVTSNDLVLYRSDFEKEGTAGWAFSRGAWGVNGGVLQETAIRAQCRAIFGDTNWASYTITLRARKTGGEEGFVIYFNYLDDNNWSYFNVGGWTNSAAGIQNKTNGAAWTFLSERVPFSVESNIWYDVRVVLNGDRIECYVNSKLVQTAVYPPLAPVSSVAADASISKPSVQKQQFKHFPLFNPILRGAIGVGAWNSQVEYSNIMVTSNNVVLYRSDFSKPGAANPWLASAGSWSVADGVLRQSLIAEDCLTTCGDTNWANYTLTLRARKTGGQEGFRVAFGCLDDDNYMFFDAGGFGNQSAVIDENIRGRRFIMTPQTPLTIESNLWYDIKVVLSGVRVACYVNSNLIQTATAQPAFTTNAVFLGATNGPDGQVLQFKVGNRAFTASLRKDRGWPVFLEPGSLVQVTGQIELESESGIDGQCDVELFSSDDVVLLQSPSWWTWRRILWISGGFLAVVTMASAWIVMISRKNRLLTVAQLELKKANDELELRVRDRTADLAKANGELKREQDLFRTLLDTSSDYIYFKDTESRFIRCSASLCKRSGLTHEQIIGKTDFDIFQKEHARPAFEQEQNIIRTGQPFTGQPEKEVHPDGHVTWVLTTKMPWRDPCGKIIGTFGISRDITSIKEAETELEHAHKQLVAASRAAGMAEVATGVLHNVGNVLNSVNVSTAVLTGQIKNSKVKSVGQVAALMNDHAAELGDFIAKDPRGQQLPQFLRNLSAQLEREQVRALDELAGLRKNVDHIKDIVAMQQGYASVAGVNSIVNVAELLDDVLRLTGASLIRHGVKLVKAFDKNLPDLNVDRHKVLQILVNLVRNAAQACEDAERPDKQLTLRATGSSGRISITVMDNGVGIPAANLARIFAHGFTTRKDGHGFGLHSSALAAKEIGGRLSVQSDGPGKGATFMLELNCDSESSQPPPGNS